MLPLNLFISKARWRYTESFIKPVGLGRIKFPGVLIQEFVEEVLHPGMKANGSSIEERTGQDCLRVSETNSGLQTNKTPQIACRETGFRPVKSGKVSD